MSATAYRCAPVLISRIETQNQSKDLLTDNNFALLRQQPSSADGNSVRDKILDIVSA